MSDMIERILLLVKNSGLTDKEVVQKSELSNSTLSEWRKHRSKPSSDAIIKIASFFNVSTDYILLGHEQGNQPTLLPGEGEWLELYRSLNTTEKQECMRFVKGYIEYGRSHAPTNSDNSESK